MFGYEEAVCKMGVAFAHSRSQKLARVVASKQCLGMFQRNSKEFLRRYVTVDKTWIHYYTRETKNHSKMWTGPGKTIVFVVVIIFHKKIQKVFFLIKKFRIHGVNNVVASTRIFSLSQIKKYYLMI